MRTSYKKVDATIKFQNFMESKYKEGEIVKERIRPSQKLVVKRFFNGMYYCGILEHASEKLLVYFERELMADREAPTTSYRII